MPKPVYTGWIRRDGINVVGEIEDSWGWKIHLHGVPGIKNGIPAFILTCPLGETPTALRIDAIDGPVKT